MWPFKNKNDEKLVALEKELNDVKFLVGLQSNLLTNHSAQLRLLNNLDDMRRNQIDNIVKFLEGAFKLKEPVEQFTEQPIETTEEQK